MIVRFITKRRERAVVLQWLRDELANYADAKFNENPDWAESQADDVHTAGGVGPDSWWLRQIEQYIGRAHVQGLDTLAGRQALCKGFAVYIGLLESVVRVHGDPPLGGFPSGTIQVKE